MLFGGVKVRLSDVKTLHDLLSMVVASCSGAVCWQWCWYFKQSAQNNNEGLPPNSSNSTQFNSLQVEASRIVVKTQSELCQKSVDAFQKYKIKVQLAK